MTQNLTEGNFSSGLNRQQLIENRTAMDQRQAALFNKSGGSGYTCPTTYNDSTQNAIMTKVCQTSMNANNINDSTKTGGKRRKTKKRKTKKRKTKKKSKKRK